MKVKIPRNHEDNNIMILYSLFKKIESNKSMSFFEMNFMYSYNSSFILSLGKNNTVSMELIGKFSDEYGDFFVGFFLNRDQVIMNILDFERFLIKESNMNEKLIHDILLFKYAAFISDKTMEIKNLYKSCEFLIKDEENFFELELLKLSTDITIGRIQKGLNERKEAILEDIKALVDENEDIMNMVRNLI